MVRWVLLIAVVLAGCSDESSPAVAHLPDAHADVVSENPLDTGSDVTATPDASPDAASPDAALGPTLPRSLTEGPGKNEDPSAWVGSDGSFHVAFFSDRSGNPDIWTTRSPNAEQWSPPTAITAPEPDYYPSVIRGKDGTLHMVWFRAAQDSAGQFAGSIWYRNSANATTWSTPLALTGASELNWTPTIAEDGAGRLWVAWASRRFGDMDCLLTSSQDGGATWSDPPLRITDSTAHDDFPFVFAQSNGRLLLTWARYALGESSPFAAPSSEIVYATSSNGFAWSAPVSLTSDGATPFVDTLPGVYPSTDGSGASIAWTSNRDDPFGDIYATGLSAGSSAAVRLTSDPGQDYSPRLVPAGPDGLYLMVWVSSRNGSSSGEDLDVFSQLIEAP